MGMDKNPMQELLRRQMGMDAFALDGDDTDIPDPWQPKPSGVRAVAPAIAPPSAPSAPPVSIAPHADNRVEPRVEIRRKF